MNEGRIVLKGEARQKDVELIEKMGIKLPQVTLLTSKLRSYVPSKRLPLTQGLT